MQLGSWIIVVSTVLYLAAAAAYAYKGILPSAYTFLCYAAANIGLIWSAESMK